MRKHKLNVDEIEVVSFRTERASARARGTVHGQVNAPASGFEITCYLGCSDACTYQGPSCVDFDTCNMTCAGAHQVCQ